MPRALPAPWLDLALSEVGTHEIVGPEHSPEVLSYFRDVKRADIKDDETAWCAASTGSWLSRTNQPIPPPNIVLLARTYETYGVACEPQRGAIGVWPRGAADWQGHVGIVIEVDHERGVVKRVSGNQRNAVTIDEAPIETALAFRWPVAATVADLRRAGSTEIRHADAIEASAVVGGITAVSAVAVAAAVSGAPEAPPAAVPDPVGPEALDLPVAVLAAVWRAALAHPWLAGIALGVVVLLIVARRIKSKRVARAAAGATLSREVA